MEPKLKEILVKEGCAECKGTGWIWVRSGEDDVDRDLCRCVYEAQNMLRAIEDAVECD